MRRVRDRLIQIQRSSASRPQSSWSRAHDRAFMASFMLAWIAVFVTDVTVSRPAVIESVRGRLFPVGDGSVHAIVLDQSTPTNAWMDELPSGTFEVSASEVRRGWPFISSRQLVPRRLDLDIFAESRPRPNAQLANDDPVGVAIESALADSPSSRALAEWPTTSSERRITWRGLLGGGLLWWVILAAAFGSAIHAARFAAHRAGKRLAERREAWRRGGCCTRCGYSLRGLEFNERCPECGMLVE